ncbi:MAG: hypothetical protein OXN17_21530 [Candidatus Poribacteria bacterium]|nr:hypothetical protein [Candidatus Poribacteria bacterium]MDE0504427.1 hypothetical protein [Candidatus Poribacteria bacterium]
MYKFVFTLSMTLLLLVANTSSAWWSGGHGILTRAAVKAAHDEMPEFFRSGGKMIAHCAFDPDVSKNRGTPVVRSSEHSEHYIDLELLDGRSLPKNRYEFIQLCTELGARPEKVGLVPYAVAEWTERLAVAFAEHRKWPDNLFIQNKCLVYAGFLAHYAQDMCQPLHLTVDYNGRRQPDGSILHKGIHEKVDALVEFLEMRPDDLAEAHEIVPLGNLMADILKSVESGHALVDRVYDLADSLPNTRDKEWVSVPAVVEFAHERARESVRLTASLYLTAWKISKSVELPNWLNRSASDR